METKFQTSFIPKKPLPSVGGASMGANISNGRRQPVKHGGSLFLNLAMFLFIISIIAGGSMYLLKTAALSSQKNLGEQLSERQKQFNPKLIEELKRVNVKIDTANNLIQKHLALSNIFDIIGRFTTAKVRFISMQLEAPTQESGDITVTLSGYGSSLAAIAFQSEVLGKLEQYGLRDIVKNPILSNPTLDATSRVTFNFSASIDPTSLYYAKTITGTSSETGIQ